MRGLALVLPVPLSRMGGKIDLPSMAPPPQAAPRQPAVPLAALPPHLRLLERFTLLFPVWTLAAALLSLPFPQLFTWLKGPAIVWALAVIMLGMGLGLQLADFRRVLARPAAAGLGVLSQYLVMPSLAALVAWGLRLEPALAVGLILVGCCPGGTASNVVTLIGRGDVALSVVMTTLSTLLAVGLTPLLTSLLAGRYVPVDGWKLLLDVLQVVLLPVALGVALKRWTPRAARRVEPLMPPVAVVAIVLIVASVVGSQRDNLLAQGPLLLLAALLLHGGGFLLGYWIPALAGYGSWGAGLAVRRTVSIEVGMQNSGLAVVLARSAFTSPLTALPGAISAVVHAVLGSLLAAWWRSRSGSGPARP
ncbi:bile acid:sodium symporter family protein [Synechococcus sp. CBW1002]|uniref:bile acid:sodium symporter family protein n=1 Tax=Synechococcus sp. CBW1002 TaxID=1353134 RepID=UPI001E45227E|nr:bile acid:sodium symporter family protein [Synechococcus sp. CBW1002]